MKPLIEFKKTTSTLLIPLAAICFWPAPMAQAVGPDTGGSIAGSNNGEGVGVLVSRTTGIWNTGTGFEALNTLTAGNQNTATGLRALFSDTSGGYNTGTGVYSLYTNSIGFFNSATGAYSLTSNATGSGNTANGYSALFFNTTGSDNTATGFAALYRNTTGSDNTALGAGAGSSPDIGSNNIYIGDAGFVGDNNVIAIGAVASSGTPYAFAYIGGIYDSFVDDRPVYIRSDGALGTLVSSRRYKEEIKPMGKASEALFALKPVTFHYKQETGKLSFGLIAEDVAEISADLVSCDKEGKPQTVRYDAVNAMLLNEFLKEHRKVEEQEATISQLKKEFQTAVAQQQREIQALTAQLKEHAAQIQKVGAQLEVSKSAEQMALNDD
jgi:hypothetical protein